MSDEQHYRRMDEILGEPVLDHEYDGIEELDNPLPGWWLATFYGAIIFSVFYFTYHNIVNDSHVAESRYKTQIAAIEAKQAEIKAEQEANLDEGALNKELMQASLAGPGKAIFEGKCASCHAADGGGLVGPNLTDAHWINGDGSPVTIFKVIRDGVNANGMPPWGGILNESEMKQVSAYVVSLKGSTPANPKAPQGEKFE